MSVSSTKAHRVVGGRTEAWEVVQAMGESLSKLGLPVVSYKQTLQQKSARTCALL